MVIVPNKLRSQLEDLVRGRFVEGYASSGKLLRSIETSIDRTESVVKTRRPMEVVDLFNTRVDHESEKLKCIFELEKEVEELRKIKESVDTLKGMFKDIK